jgi:hypothetical protein
MFPQVVDTVRERKGDRGMFIRIQEKRGRGGQPHYYASLVRADRKGGRVVQTTVAYLGRVEEDQIPFLKAAYAKKKPRLVWDEDGADAGGGGDDSGGRDG